MNTINSILNSALRCGVDLSDVIKPEEKDASRFSDPHARVSFDRYMEIFDLAAHRSMDGNFGLHLAERQPEDCLGIVGRIMAACPTVGLAVDKFVEYYPVLNSAVKWKLVKKSKAIRISMVLERAPWQMIRHYVEATLAHMLICVRGIAQQNVSPTRVRFQHGTPLATADHKRIFRGEVLFDQLQNELTFEPVVLNLPCRTADGELLSTLEGRASVLKDRLPRDDDFLQQVRQAIFDAFSACDLSMRSIARRLDLSPAELRRRLSEQNQSYQAIASAMRRELASVYLQDRKWSTTEVARALGFCDPASFKRSFKRWTGKSPRDYRRSFFGD